mmetsp:Transcript_9780/g.19359  ORF Transcript_9780/g.19359 Transcript_9780/m.19359 type:complete len:99 (-) Transcript_9780:499-795(-)
MYDAAIIAGHCLHGITATCTSMSTIKRIITYSKIYSVLPSHLATTGVRATVGGNLTGDRALCAAYAIANVPTFSLVSDTCNPTLDKIAATSTPAFTKA